MITAWPALVSLAPIPPVLEMSVGSLLCTLRLSWDVGLATSLAATPRRGVWGRVGGLGLESCFHLHCGVPALPPILDL
jgi:hypothetical protein